MKATKKAKRERRALVILLLLLVVLIEVRTPSGRVGPRKVKPEGAGRVTPASLPVAGAPAVRQDWPTVLGRDPFVCPRSGVEEVLVARIEPASVPEVVVDAQALADRSLRLRSVLIGVTPRAVINGTIVGVGASIDGFLVTDIERGGVTLVRENQTVTIWTK